MKTYLKPSGDCYILEIDKKVLEELNIDPGKPVEMNSIGNMLTVTNGDESGNSEHLTRVLTHIEAKYAATFKRLSE